MAGVMMIMITRRSGCTSRCSRQASLAAIRIGDKLFAIAIAFRVTSLGATAAATNTAQAALALASLMLAAARLAAAAHE